MMSRSRCRCAHKRSAVVLCAPCVVRKCGGEIKRCYEDRLSLLFTAAPHHNVSSLHPLPSTRPPGVPVAAARARFCEFVGDPRSSSLRGTTDGHTLKVTWDRGSLVVNLYASVDTREVGPVKMRRGTLILTLRKMRRETWPAFERRVPSVHQLGAVAVPVDADVPVAVVIPLATAVPVEYYEDRQPRRSGHSTSRRCPGDHDDDMARDGGNNTSPAASWSSSWLSPSSSSSSSSSFSSSWESLRLSELELFFFCCTPMHGDAALPPRHPSAAIRPERTAGLSAEGAAEIRHVALVRARHASDNAAAPRRRRMEPTDAEDGFEDAIQLALAMSASESAAPSSPTRRRSVDPEDREGGPVISRRRIIQI